MWEIHKCTDPVMGGIINSTRNGQRVRVATEKRFTERINQADHQDLDDGGLLAMVQRVRVLTTVSLPRETGEYGEIYTRQWQQLNISNL